MKKIPPSRHPQYLLIAPFPDTAEFYPCAVAQTPSIIFRMTKNIGQYNFRRLWERGLAHRWPPFFSSTSVPHFTPFRWLIWHLPPARQTQRGPRHFLRQPKLISFRAPAEHTQAKEIWIIISDWYDWIQSQGEVMEMQKQQRWEMKSMHWGI